MRSLKVVTSTTGGLALLVAAVVCLNIIASRLSVRVDATQDKVFSLSDGTKRILDKLDHDVTVRLYFSRSLKDLPVMVKTYATRVEEVLNEYGSHSHGHLTVEVVDPKPDSDDEEWAQKYGLNGVRLPKGDQMYFGVVFSQGGKEVVLPYLDPRREEFLEYDLSEALVGTGKKAPAKVGVMSSLPVDGGPGGEAWAFLTDLKRNFQVETVADTAKEINQDLKFLLVIHPKNLSDETQYALDQYVVHGGRLIVAVDPMSRTDLQVSGSQMRAMGQMPQVASDLPKLFSAWGIDYDKNNLVGDVSLATQINAGGQVLAYPFFLSLHGDALATGSPVTASLHEMLYAEGGFVEQKKGSSYSFEPLLKTTKDSGAAGAALAGLMMPQDMARELKVDSKERVLAALVRGKFKSAFPEGRPKPAGAPGAKDDKPASAVPHKAEADQETSVIVVADVDFLADQNAADKFRFGNQVMVRARNDNLNFLFNAADILSGSDDLIAIRSRGRIARPFTRVAELQKSAQVKWQTEEEQLTAQLTDLQKKLSALQQERTDGNRFVLSSAQQDEIGKFRDEERRIRTRRREVRKNLREDIEALGRHLVALNMLVLPLATSAFGAAVFVGRSRRPKEQRKSEVSHG